MQQRERPASVDEFEMGSNAGAGFFVGARVADVTPRNALNWRAVRVCEFDAPINDELAKQWH
jgi:hypothetical protein